MKYRRDSSFPYQNWRPFPDEAIVKAYNAYGHSQIAPAGSLWWGYEEECGVISEGVIIKARRLDKPKHPTP